MIKTNDILEKIQQDKTNGSSTIALYALESFLELVDHITPYQLLELKNSIIKTKPAMSALKNIMEYAYDELELFNFKNLKDIKHNIIEKIQKARIITIKNTVDYLKQNEILFIYTCSYSSTVKEIIKQYYKINPHVLIILVKSVWNKTDYSKIFRKELKALNIKTDKMKFKDMIYIDYGCSLIGADSVMSNSYIINGTPSRKFAKISAKLGLPFIVAAESFKYTDNTVLEDGFEIVKIKNISKLISDELFK